MADQDTKPETEVVVVPLVDEQIDEGPIVPKEAPPPPPPGIVEVRDGSSNTIVLEDPPPASPPAAPRDIAPAPPKDDGQPIVGEPPKDDGQPIVGEPPKDDGQPIVGEPPKDDGQPIVGEPPKDDGQPIVGEPPKDDGAEDPSVVDTASAAPPPTADLHVPAPTPHDRAATVTEGAPDAAELPSDLFAPAPAFATGAAAPDAVARTFADAAQGAGRDETSGEGGVLAVGEFEGSVPEPVAVLEETDDSEDDDPGFFEQVADKVGDLWDDVTDAVT